MDSLTQIVLGAAVGQAVAGRELKNRALLYGAIAGTIPDLDVIVGMFLDPIKAVEIHRGLSHSVFFAFFLALGLGWVVHKIEAKASLSFKKGFWLFFLGLFTHAVLDVFTTWGTRVLWPISDYPFAFKSIFVIDPLYTLPFILCLVLSVKQGSDLNRRMRFNTIGLGISSAYLIVTLGLKAIAFKVFENQLNQRSIVYSEVSVKPSALNTILWNAIVDTDKAYLLGDYSFFDTSEVVFTSYAKNHHLLGDLQFDPLIQRLITLSEGWYIISEKDGVLYFNDLRFGLLKSDPDDIQFAFSYQLYQDASGQWQALEVPKDRSDGVALLKALFVRLQGR